MGADLIVAYIAIPKDHEPDFDEARRRLAGLPNHEIARLIAEAEQCDDIATLYPYDLDAAPADAEEESWVPDDQLVAARRDAEGALNRIVAAWTGADREFTRIVVAGADVLLTGELSYGDMPAGVRDLNWVVTLGLATAAGFTVGEAPLGPATATP